MAADIEIQDQVLGMSVDAAALPVAVPVVGLAISIPMRTKKKKQFTDDEIKEIQKQEVQEYDKFAYRKRTKRDIVKEMKQLQDTGPCSSISMGLSIKSNQNSTESESILRRRRISSLVRGRRRSSLLSPWIQQNNRRSRRYSKQEDNKQISAGEEEKRLSSGECSSEGANRWSNNGSAQEEDQKNDTKSDEACLLINDKTVVLLKVENGEDTTSELQQRSSEDSEYEGNKWVSKEENKQNNEEGNRHIINDNEITQPLEENKINDMKCDEASLPINDKSVKLLKEKNGKDTTLEQQQKKKKKLLKVKDQKKIVTEAEERQQMEHNYANIEEQISIWSDNLEKIENERQEWKNIMKEHEDRVADIEYIADSNEGNHGLSLSPEENTLALLSAHQREFLNNRIDTASLLQRMKDKRDRGILNIKYIQTTVSMLEPLRDAITTSLDEQSRQIELTSLAKGKDVKTPRTLIKRILGKD